MKPFNFRTKCVLALAVAGILATGPALAEKPSWAGNGKATRDERPDRHDSQRDARDARHDANGRSARGGDRREYFETQHRAAVRDYYGEQHRAGRCPPGLAKKHNGCMPPGQAKKWQIGQPLARDVIYYEVPRPLVVQIGVPPSGYRYVRVASDILLMSIGTGMIIDAIRDLGRS